MSEPAVRLDFATLRARGIEHLQALSGQRWTDYNVHDPGVTILEQLCYAMTEQLYHAASDVADLLAGADGQIDFERQCLHPPHVILPSRPTTLRDYRCLLLGAVAGVDDIRLETQRPGAAGRGLAGLHNLVVRLEREQQGLQHAVLQQARTVYLAQRNLGEDLAHGDTVIRDVPCVLHAQLEITGARDPADLLAEVYLRCDDFITGRPRARSFESVLAEGGALEDLFDGPLAEAGAYGAGAFAAADARTLFIGDLSAELAGIEGLARVTRIALECGEAAPASGSVAWRGSNWALRLQLPVPQAALPSIRLRRGAGEITVNAHEVASRVQDRLAARRMRHVPASQWPQALDLPMGSYWRPQRYYSIQNHFPANYALGQHGLPVTASRRDQAQLLQLEGYLLLFEQVLANGQEQLQHLQELFSASLERPRSYWWQVVSAESIKGVEQLYLTAPQNIEAEAFAPLDHPVERKHRLLDYLLALYGETLSQDALRESYPYLDPADLEGYLLHLKAAYLRGIVRLSRDRGAGFDYSKRSWDDPDNCSCLQRRISLLLGFTHAHSRSLTAALRSRELAVVEETPGLSSWEAQPEQALLPVPRNESLPAIAEDEVPPLAFAGDVIDVQLLRRGVHRRHYKLAAHTHSAGYQLLLGGDAAAGWWYLGDYSSQGAAARAVDALRNSLLQLNHASEGLHLVEHLLLRPIGPREHPGASADFYLLRLSVVFPAWTARCHHSEFRRLAQQTVELNCPAHLRVQCLWLGFDEMLAFERCYIQWLEAKCDHVQQPDSERAATLNAAAHALVATLQAHSVAASDV